MIGGPEVTLGQIARVLQLIEDPPNRRDRPLASDPPGRYDFWFDGGARVSDTGTIAYHFADGTKALTGPTLRLHLLIQFPNGVEVRVDESGEPPVARDSVL